MEMDRRGKVRILRNVHRGVKVRMLRTVKE